MVRQARQLRMEFADKFTIAELIHAWGVYRDQGKWKELRGTFTPDGHISVSWFRGPFEQFVERCRSGLRRVAPGRVITCSPRPSNLPRIAP
jgi:hypothetical protein